MIWSGKAMAVALVGATLTLAGPALSQAQAPAAPAAPAQPGAASPGTAEPGTPQPGPAQAADAFGEEVTLASKTFVYMKGTATWDAAFDTLIDAFKSVRGYVDREKLKPSGPFMTVYTATDDTGFQFKAGLPIETDPKEPPHGDLAVGKSPDGKALKFVHRGSYDAMDATYDAITNYLDEKKLDAKDLFIEQYLTDPLATPQEKLVIEIYVPVQ